MYIFRNHPNFRSGLKLYFACKTYWLSCHVKFCERRKLILEICKRIAVSSIREGLRLCFAGASFGQCFWYLGVRATFYAYFAHGTRWSWITATGNSEGVRLEWEIVMYHQSSWSFGTNFSAASHLGKLRTWNFTKDDLHMDTTLSVCSKFALNLINTRAWILYWSLFWHDLVRFYGRTWRDSRWKNKMMNDTA